jgi:hypothetical protein
MVTHLCVVCVGGRFRESHGGGHCRSRGCSDPDAPRGRRLLQVCAVDGRWVEELLPRLRGVDVRVRFPSLSSRTLLVGETHGATSTKSRECPQPHRHRGEERSSARRVLKCW